MTATTCPATLDGNACTEPRGHDGFHRCPGHAWDDSALPTDADVEHARRAMVEAHQTGEALNFVYKTNGEPGVEAACRDAQEHMIAATRAYVAAKRARGGL